MRRHRLFALPAVVLMAVACLSCGKKAEPLVAQFSGPTMGTLYHVTAHGLPRDGGAQSLQDAVQAALDGVNAKMSTYQADSELSRFNAAPGVEPFQVSPDTAEVFRIARRVSEESNGTFDITVGPLVNAWGFGPGTFTAPPDDGALAVLRERVGWEKVTVNPDNTLVKSRPDVYCDLSAVAKGYGVDKAADALDALGVANYMVEVGGEVRARGLNPDGKPWRIGIEKPTEGERSVQEVVGLSGMAMATSGDYRNFREQDGRRISHEIDPRTGRPVTHMLASATVLHPSCALADAYATALMVLGPEDGYDFAVKLDLPACLIVRNQDGTFSIARTPRFAAFLQF